MLRQKGMAIHNATIFGKKMSSIQPVTKQFILQTRLFNNVLEGIEDPSGSDRLSKYVNHLQWIAGHLTNSRYHLGPALGLSVHFPYAEVYTDLSQPPPHNRAIDPSIEYPSLTEIKKAGMSLRQDLQKRFPDSPVSNSNLKRLPEYPQEKPCRICLLL